MEYFSEGPMSTVLLGDLYKSLCEIVASLTDRAGWAEGLLVGFADGDHPRVVVVLQVEALDPERAPQPGLGPDELSECADVDSWRIGCMP